MIGTKLGSYEIIEELGQGGMATVYRAYQPHMERYVAVKVIRQAIMNEATTRERFQREARIIARLEHPHLLPIYDFDGAHDPPYIVMRYLEGGTLKEALAGRRLPFAEISYLLRQIGSSLDYAHRQGVIHRDIKPSNIMIDQEGNAFVMDFGIARMTGRDGGREGADGGLTGTGTIIGTPDYMAPEQGYGTSEIGPQADVYSLGVMLFEMITGQLPFKGQSPMETMLHHLTKPVPSAHELNPEIPVELDAILLQAMAKEPGGRYDAVIDFVAAVVDALGGVVATTPEALQEAALESIALVDARRAGHRDQIEATMAEFAQERGGRLPDTDSQATPAKQHRTVTAMYASVLEFNELVELDRGPEAARREVHDLWTRTSQIVTEHGGSVFNQSERDLLVVWGASTAREDDPERAIRASLAIRDELGSRAGPLILEDEPLPIRIGLNTGPALIALDDETGSYSASGATVNLANRLADNADGVVLITHDTYRHVQGVFDINEDRPLRVRRAGGLAQVNTYRVNEAKPRAFRLQPRGVEGVDTQMVGRRAELEELQKAYFTAVEDSESQAVTVVAAPGLGKSRLLYEFAAWAELRPETYYIFRGRATPAMTNRPYGLWRDIVSFRFEILDSDSPKLVQQKLESGVSDLIGEDGKLAYQLGYLAGFDLSDSPYHKGDPQALVEQSRRAALQFFERLTRLFPVVMQLEDLHHADDASLDLLAELTSAGEDLPLLVVAMARPELYQKRPTWGSGQDFHIRIDLRPLSKRDSRELAAEILQKVVDVPRELRDLLVDRAEGNPHYMEELVKMLLEDRVIQKLDPERWTVESSRLKNLRVPPTLVGLLQARFDSLLYPEKLTLQRAAVVGRVFYDSALAALDDADDTSVADLQPILDHLTEREFIFPRETSAFEGSTEYIFGQAMMRDLILETLLEQQVITYNKAMAQWLIVQSGERAGEYDGLIADHYEAAGELFPAAEYLARACQAARNLGAYQDGINAGMRVLALVDRCDQGAEAASLRLKVQMILADMNGSLGRYETAVTLLESALQGARSIDDRLTEANALAHLGRIKGAWQVDHEVGLQYLEQALEINQELDDKEGLVFILRQLGNVSNNLGEYEKATAYLERSLELAREIEDLAAVATALNGMGITAHGSGDLEKAVAIYKEAADAAAKLDDNTFHTMIVQNTGFVYAEMGRYEDALEKANKVIDSIVDADNRYLLESNWELRGWAEIGMGQYQLAKEHLHQAAVLSRELGSLSTLTFTVLLFALLEAKTGDLVKALKWFGLCKRQEDYQPGGFRRYLDRVLDEVTTGIPDEEVAAALAGGADLDLDEVIDEILVGEN